MSSVSLHRLHAWYESMPQVSFDAEGAVDLGTPPSSQRQGWAWHKVLPLWVWEHPWHYTNAYDSWYNLILAIHFFVNACMKYLIASCKILGKVTTMVYWHVLKRDYKNILLWTICIRFWWRHLFNRLIS